MAIKAIIFDLYGVLGLNGWQAFKNEQQQESPRMWSQVKQFGEEADAGRATTEEFIHFISESTGQPKSVIRGALSKTVVNRPLMNLLPELAGVYKLGLLSNASSDVVSMLFSDEQRALFDEIITSFHVGLTKPDPAIFLLMCERLQVQPHECLFIDDQTGHLNAARELGMQTLQYTSFQTLKEELVRILV